uniref:Uncharacterized protein n=1 Tax=Setaria italica TaxID=4555 RepID=K3Y4B5_SETIT
MPTFTKILGATFNTTFIYFDYNMVNSIKLET